jgi:hypothetical protein
LRKSSPANVDTWNEWRVLHVVLTEMEGLEVSDAIDARMTAFPFSAFA